MKNIKRITVLGGDLRQKYLAELLCDDGFEVKTYGIFGTENNCRDIKHALSDAEILFMPTPMTRDGYRLNADGDILISNITELVPKNCKIFGGGIPPRFKDYFMGCGIEITDIFDDSGYLVRNAEISAEGAVFNLMSSLDKTVSDSTILVCGYGRIGKSLALKLKSLGADVTVAARRVSDLSDAIRSGYKTDKIDYYRESIFDLNRKYDAIFCTVPSWIFSCENASLLKNTVYIELASAPYGGEVEFMKKSCEKYILASGIPGKYAPMSAAKAIFSSLPHEYMKGE